MNIRLINNLLLPVLCILILTGCKKDRYVFTLKNVKLNEYHKSGYPVQNLFIKIVSADNANNALATTEEYPGQLPLPVTFGIHPSARIHLYRDRIAVQLWGETSGLIASSTVDMKEYKIIYPIEMETENDAVSFTLLGSWE